MDTRAFFLLKSEVKGHVRTDVSVTGDKLWWFLGVHEWKVLPAENDPGCVKTF